MWNKSKQRKMFSFMSNLQTYYLFKIDFQNMDQHTGGKWLIQGTKRRQVNQLQSLEPPIEYPSRECKHDIKESEGNMFHPIFKENVPRGGNIQGVVHLQNQNYYVTESLKCSSKAMNGHKNPNDSHNYHDEHHDEIKFYQRKNNRSTYWHPTPEQRKPQNQSNGLWCGDDDQCTMSRGTYIQRCASVPNA